MSLAVHVLREPDEASRAFLRARLHPSVAVTFGREPPKPADHQILVAGRPNREHITGNPDLEALIVPFAGLPPETLALMREFPQIAVHNLHHNAGAAAEMAVTLLLSAAKFIVPIDRAMRRHDWRPRYRSNPAVVLGGKTALILGHGAIGQHVARMCGGLGMDVIAMRRRATDDPSEAVHPPEALHSLLPRADVLIIALPLTSETEGLIGKEELALLPAKAVLVNVGRGPIIDEEALFSALCDSTLHAAGLDVWYNYPTDAASRSNRPPSAYPFHELDNVVLSPHRAGTGGAEEIEMRRMAHLASLLNAAAAGDEMPNRVDIEAGY
jgi:phosphoglycerate dehydrogenase-like enzyme